MDFYDNDDEFWLEEPDSSWEFDEGDENYEETAELEALWDKRDTLDEDYAKFLKGLSRGDRTRVAERIGGELRPDPGDDSGDDDGLEVLKAEIEWLEKALKAIEEHRGESQDVMSQYRQFYLEKYPKVDPSAKPMTQLAQERKLRQLGGPRAIAEKRERTRKEFLAEPAVARRRAKVQGERQQQTVKRVAKEWMKKIECSNLDAVSKARIPSDRLIRLRVRDQTTNKRHAVCYDVVNLYEILASGGGMERDALWIDPTYRTILSAEQKKRIRQHYQKVATCPITNFSMQLGVVPMPQAEEMGIRLDQANFPEQVLRSALEQGKLGDGSTPIIFRALNQTTKTDRARAGFLTAFQFTAKPGTIEMHPDAIKKLLLGQRSVTDSVLLSECPLPKVKEVRFRPHGAGWDKILGTTKADLDAFMTILHDEVSQLSTLSEGSMIKIAKPRAVLEVLELKDDAGRSIKSGVVVETDIDLEFDRN